MNLNRDLYQLFHKDISLEYTAHFHYLQCRIALEHQSVGLPGLAKFFAGEASEEWDHAKAFIDKLQQRGGQFSFSNLDKTGILEASFNLGDPTKIGASICDMIAKSLYLEKEVAKKVLEIKNVADKYEDADISQWIDHWIEHQMSSIDEFERLQTQYNAMKDSPSSIYIYDQTLLCKKE